MLACAGCTPTQRLTCAAVATAAVRAAGLPVAGLVADVPDGLAVLAGVEVGVPVVLAVAVVFDVLVFGAVAEVLSDGELLDLRVSVVLELGAAVVDPLDPDEGCGDGEGSVGVELAVAVVIVAEALVPDVFVADDVLVADDVFVADVLEAGALEAGALLAGALDAGAVVAGALVVGLPEDDPVLAEPLGVAVGLELVGVGVVVGFDVDVDVGDELGDGVVAASGSHCCTVAIDVATVVVSSAGSGADVASVSPVAARTPPVRKPTTTGCTCAIRMRGPASAVRCFGGTNIGMSRFSRRGMPCSCSTPTIGHQP